MLFKSNFTKMMGGNIPVVAVVLLDKLLDHILEESNPLCLNTCGDAHFTLHSFLYFIILLF